ncbi:hypothetical protein J2751_002545 [Halorubrum alkaliphilum]|uniref:CARDB domain-containing protein n=1 Tax=Halorubrum alkaliphilum TaxID=261290 RepID=A0A8T4GH65_9EURY|nr:CARDB domain-containing protein [Halorubrum alkaliphilum]MBP1923503.1 hypothetical protein [Halorubrum alkaliphilum]
MSRLRTILAVVALVLAGSLALATGASVIGGPADTLADDRVAIQPADGSNGDYAYLDADDELVVDVSASNPNLDGEFSGVNVNSRAVIGDVFTITYTAGETASVWIDHDVPGVSFVVADDSTAAGSDPDYRLIEGDEGDVTLAPNESVSVGLVVDTTDLDAVAGTITENQFSIHATVTEPDEEGDTVDSSGPSLTIDAPSRSERRFGASGAEDGDTVRFDADEMRLDDRNVTLDRLDLVGASAGSYDLAVAGSPEAIDEAGPLDADGDPRPLAYLSLEYDFDPMDVDGLRFLFSADSAFLAESETAPEAVTLYRLNDDGVWDELDAGLVDERLVELRDSPPDRTHFSATSDGFSTFAVAVHTPRIGAVEASIATDSIDVGESTTVEARVENDGGAAGDHSLTLTADGDSLATREVALDPGESTTVSFPVSIEAAGDYEVAVDDAPAGTLRVTDVATADGDQEGDGASSDGDAGDGGDAGDDTDASLDDTAEPADGPTEEPGGFGLRQAGGLSALLFIVVVSLLLARRAPGGS